jgi:hypothetical protein
MHDGPSDCVRCHEMNAFTFLHGVGAYEYVFTSQYDAAIVMKSLRICSRIISFNDHTELQTS